MGLSPLKRSAESSRVSFCLEPDIYLINFAFHSNISFFGDSFLHN